MECNRLGGLTGASAEVSTSGANAVTPSPFGSALFGANVNACPGNSLCRPLKDLVTPLDSLGRPDPNGRFLRPGASRIYREQRHRFIGTKFSADFCCPLEQIGFHLAERPNEPTCSENRPLPAEQAGAARAHQKLIFIRL